MSKIINFTPVSFFIEKIRSLRFSAQLIYDRGNAKGLSQEEIYKTMDPITSTMKDFTHQAVTKDIRGVIFAVKSLKNEARAHQEDAKFLVEKEMNTRAHIEQIENHILAEMSRQGVKQLTDGDFSVSLVEQDGKSSLHYR